MLSKELIQREVFKTDIFIVLLNIVDYVPNNMALDTNILEDEEEELDEEHSLIFLNDIRKTTSKICTLVTMNSFID